MDSLGEKLFSTWANETGVLRESDPTFLKSDRGQLPGIYAAMYRIKERAKVFGCLPRNLADPLQIQRDIYGLIPFIGTRTIYCYLLIYT